MLKECERDGCVNTFKYRPNNKVLRLQRFCSRKCWLLINNTTEQGRLGPTSSKYREYVKVHRGSGSGRYIKEDGQHQHRLVAEQVLGRPLKSTEVVHHIDDDGHNNDHRNLVITTQRHHNYLHKLARQRRG